MLALFPAAAQAQGAVEIWVQRYGAGNGDDRPEAIAVGADGNVIVTGWSRGDYATIKYSSAGVPLWTNRYNGSGNSRETLI